MKDAPNKKSSMWPSADVAPWFPKRTPSKENAPASRHVNLFVFQFWSMLFARSSLRFDGAKHQYYQKDNKVAEGRHPFAPFRNPGMIKSPKVNANHCRGSSMHSKRCKREEPPAGQVGFFVFHFATLPQKGFPRFTSKVT